MKTRIIAVALVCGGFMAIAGQPPTTRYVDDDTCPEPGSGTEDDPFCLIQDCIDAATDGDECVVAPGTYFENINLLGKAFTLRSTDGPDVTTIDANDSGTAVTCISGEGEDTVLDGFTITHGNAVRGGGMHIINSSPIVTDCSFIWNSAINGGGMYCAGSSPTVSDCSFSMNTAESGGGMANDGESDPTVTNCLFEGNIAEERGGGMANSFESTPVIIGCLFKENSAALCGGGIHNTMNFEDRPKVIGCSLVGNMAQHGGGMCNESSRLWAIDSKFIENTATQGGGGGMFSQSSNLFVANCTFRGNAATDTESTAQDGEVAEHSGSLAVTDRARRVAAVTSGWGGGMINLSGTLVMTGSLFSDNSAKIGGGMFDDTVLSTLTNSTFSGNSATNLGGGILVNSPGSPMVSNCIVWDNTAADGAEIFHGGAGLLTIRYSDVAGGQEGVQGPGPVAWEAGNIELDPLFFDPAGGSFRLLANSPCIDSADNTVLPSDPVDLDGDGDTEEPTPHDLDGNPRFVDDPNTDDTGFGDPPIVDMGAYEFQSQDPCADDGDGRVTICHIPPGNPDNTRTITISVRALPAHLAHGDLCGPCEGDSGVLLMAGDGEACSADLNVDVVVDASDLAILLGSWGPCEGCPTDFNGDGLVNAFDLAQVLGAWGLCP